MELGRFATLFEGYTELRVQHNEIRRVMLVNGSVVNLRNSLMPVFMSPAWVMHLARSKAA